MADCLRRRQPGIGVHVLGTEVGLEARLVPARGYDLRFVPKVPMPRRPNMDLVRLPGRLKAAIDAADQAIEATGAQVVVGFGGYVSTPAYLAARRRRLPIVIHEQNARAGLANKLGARLTPYVAVTFPSTQLRGATVLGMPLRAEITHLDRAATRDAALAHFGLESGRPTVLVTGGSLGAKRLNDAFETAVTDLSTAGVQVLHLTGAGKEFTPQPPAGGARYVALPYCDRMDLAYAAADLVVARAGANTVCELTAVGLPAVYVPLPIGNGEQRLNAEDVVAAGGGLLVDDSSVTPTWVREQFIALATDRERVAAMATAAASVGSAAPTRSSST